MLIPSCACCVMGAVRRCDIFTLCNTEKGVWYQDLGSPVQHSRKKDMGNTGAENLYYIHSANV